MARPAQTAIIGALPIVVPFVGPEAMERASGVPFRARIGANESSFGPAPSVIERMRQVAADQWMYCDPDNTELKAAIAAFHGVPFESVVVGGGIDGLLSIAVRMYVAPGDVVVTSLGAYPTFNFHVDTVGGRLIRVPFRNDREDLDGLLHAVRRENAKMVYLSNPDNPMGTWWDADDVMRFADALSPETVFVLDEAYGETGPASARPPIDVSRPNVLRMQTFSKAYGLAGIRLGYCIGDPAVIPDFEKVRDHYGTSRLAQEAGVAALADQAWLQTVVAKVASGRERIGQIARDNGLSPIASGTNFVTVDCGSDGAFALKVLHGLLKRGVFIRKPMVPGLDRCIRITAGQPYELDILAEELPRALGEARAARVSG